MANQSLADRCLQVMRDLARQEDWQPSPDGLEALAETILPFLQAAPDPDDCLIRKVARNYYHDGPMVQAMYVPNSPAGEKLWEEWRDYFVRQARWACTKGIRPNEVEDLAQEVCIQAQKALHNFRFESRLKTFFHSIFTNCYKQWIRDHRELDQGEILAGDEEAEGEVLISQLPDPSPLPEAVALEQVHNADLRELIWEEIVKILRSEDFQILYWYYVEDEMAGEDVVELYPRVAHHLQRCASCRDQYKLLREVLEQETAGAFGEAPDYISFETWFQRQTQPPLWQELTRGVRRLIADIPILIRRSGASFGPLPAPLVPQFAPAVAYRGKGLALPTEKKKEEELLEILELPSAEANLVIRISIGAVFEGKGTLLVEVANLEPVQPVTQARVILRDKDGRLLEGTASDEEGRAFFRDLEADKYLVQVRHANQTWEFGVTLKSV